MVVHTTTDECVVVSPFEFRPFADLDLLMALPDNRMLRYTSTSPECEADDFCDLVRESFVFLRDVAVGDVFGSRRRTMMCDDNHDDDDDDDNDDDDDDNDDGDDYGDGDFEDDDDRFEPISYRWKGVEWCQEDRI